MDDQSDSYLSKFPPYKSKENYTSFNDIHNNFNDLIDGCETGDTGNKRPNLEGEHDRRYNNGITYKKQQNYRNPLTGEKNNVQQDNRTVNRLAGYIPPQTEQHEFTCDKNPSRLTVGGMKPKCL